MATNTTEQPALLTQLEAAQILGVSRRSMHRLLVAGTLRPITIAGLGRPRYRRADVERLARGVSP